MSILKATTGLRGSLQIPRSYRLIHYTVARHDLVGPPDSVSHLRPVIYDDAPPEAPSPNSHHPYSLKEFKGDAREYQWKMQRQQLDTYNHAYWTDVSAILSISHSCP